jgi:hypothetical protein
MRKSLIIMLVFVLTILVTNRGSDAHHFKGLPHFSYFENDPQVPQEEFLAQAGAYEYSLVVYDFQGLKREDTQQPNDVRFYLVVFGLNSNTAYSGPATLEIMDGETVVSSQYFERSEEESLYSMRQALSSTGKYQLRVRLPSVEVVGVIPFQLSSQKMHWGRWLVLVLIVVVIVAAYGSRKARVAMDRKENAHIARS